MIPDIFSKEIIQYDISRYKHEINYSKHTESLVFTATYTSDDDFEDADYDIYDDDDDPTPKEVISFYLIKDVPQDSIWMSLLDFNASDSPKTLDAFQYIEKAFDYFSFLDLKNKSLFEESHTLYRIPYKADVLNHLDELAENVLKCLKEAVNIEPAISYIYPFFQMTLNQLWNGKHFIEEGKENDYLTDTIFSSLAKEVSHFREYYEQARTAVYSIFMRPEELHVPVTSDESAELYKIYAALHKISLFNTHRTGEDNEHGEPENWDDFLIDNHGVEISNVYGYAFPSLKKLVIEAIDNLSSSNTILRKCALCGGYFKTKWGSKQTCCSRQYRDTKTTCYEYASRKQYQDRLKEHPVYQEYIKAYNRLYGRIRRKTVPANTMLADKLKDLRDEYYEKYDTAEADVQESILQEFIRKNDELLS